METRSKQKEIYRHYWSPGEFRVKTYRPIFSGCTMESLLDLDRMKTLMKSSFKDVGSSDFSSYLSRNASAVIGSGFFKKVRMDMYECFVTEGCYEPYDGLLVTNEFIAQGFIQGGR